MQIYNFSGNSRFLQLPYIRTEGQKTGEVKKIIIKWITGFPAVNPANINFTALFP